MNRINLINYFIQSRNYKSYLEISLHNMDRDFTRIHCSNRLCTLPGASDDFFANNHEIFDIIFIDGLHTESQVRRDLKNALIRLVPGGLIILHDCMPPDSWHQRNVEDYHEGENWNGAVWKTALREFNRSCYKCILLDMDWGCGVIDTANMQKPFNRALPEELIYELHYDWLLKYKQSIAEYLRDNVKVFYHLACMGNWESAFREQMSQLHQNGFKQIQLSVLGSMENFKITNAILEESEMEIATHFYDPDLTHFEKPALKAIEEYSREHIGYVLYLHSKGVSNPTDGSKIKWRQLMMRELVENWEKCMLQLLKYDIIGVNWRDMPPISHFCGNFWYASTLYLRTLTDFSRYYDDPLYKIWDRISDKRLGCEFWISSGREAPKILSLVYRNVDFCNPNFWRDK